MASQARRPRSRGPDPSGRDDRQGYCRNPLSGLGRGRRMWRRGRDGRCCGRQTRRHRSRRIGLAARTNPRGPSRAAGAARRATSRRARAPAATDRKARRGAGGSPSRSRIRRRSLRGRGDVAGRPHRARGSRRLREQAQAGARGGTSPSLWREGDQSRRPATENRGEDGGGVAAYRALLLCSRKST